jgi:hypothetical protein
MDWIEDDGRRHDLFKERLPADVRLVWAKNAATGLGILGRLSPSDYAGILFDHASRSARLLWTVSASTAVTSPKRY